MGLSYAVLNQVQQRTITGIVHLRKPIFVSILVVGKKRASVKRAHLLCRSDGTTIMAAGRYRLDCGSSPHMDFCFMGFQC